MASQSEAVAMCLDVAAGNPGVNHAYISEWIAERTVTIHELAETRQPEKVVRYLADKANDDVIALTTFYQLLTGIITQATVGGNEN